MAKWTLKNNNLESLNLVGIHPLISKLLAVRGVASGEEIDSFINPNYEKGSHDPFLFSDMEKAVKRIEQARNNKEKIVIFGDYDADGITSSAILKETFDALGIESSVYIPDKRTEGYGMNLLAIDIFKIMGVKLIVTVDCGITNIAEVEKASGFGIDVIITDHHHVPKEIPNALAIINPHQEGCGYPFEDLAGVGVAFKFVQAIFMKLMPEKLQQTKWMLDLVAIGTIADCVPLIGENRLIVKYGLVVLSKTRRTGLKELFTVGRIQIDESSIPDTKKVSFYIAPRINAAGRINHANLAYNLVVENDTIKARDLALELEANNTERQKITASVVDEIKILAENSCKDKKLIFAIGEHYPIGVVGLVAGKIAQKYNKPTAVFQKGLEISKGSFRSISQLNIIEAIGKCGHLLIKFGGHSQAAGVSVANDKLDEFQNALDEIIQTQLSEADLEEEIMIDTEIKPNEISYDLVEDIEKLKPYGIGNEEPLFLINRLTVKERRFMGADNKHVKFYLSPTDPNDQPFVFEAVCFNGAEKFSTCKDNECVDIVCNLQKDEWNGNRKIQFNLIDMRPSAA